MDVALAGQWDLSSSPSTPWDLLREHLRCLSFAFSVLYRRTQLPVESRLLHSEEILQDGNSAIIKN